MSTARRFDWLFRPRDSDADAPLSAEARFAEALADLPAAERSALALSEIGGLDQEEIAARLGTDAIVVDKLLSRARDAVRASLAANGRRVVGALTPLQAWWQSGASAPAIRTAGVAAVAVLGVGVAHDARSTMPRPERVSLDRHAPELVTDAPVSTVKTTRSSRAAAPGRTVRAVSARASVASPPAAAGKRAVAQKPTVVRVKLRPPVRAQQPPPESRPAPPVAPVAAAEPTIARTVSVPEHPRVAEVPPLPDLPVELPLPEAPVLPPVPPTPLPVPLG